MEMSGSFTSRRSACYSARSSSRRAHAAEDLKRFVVYVCVRRGRSHNEVITVISIKLLLWATVCEKRILNKLEQIKAFLKLGSAFITLVSEVLMQWGQPKPAPSNRKKLGNKIIDSLLKLCFKKAVFCFKFLLIWRKWIKACDNKVMNSFPPSALH